MCVCVFVYANKNHYKIIQYIIEYSNPYWLLLCTIAHVQRWKTSARFLIQKKKKKKILNIPPIETSCAADSMHSTTRNNMPFMVEPKTYTTSYHTSYIPEHTHKRDVIIIIILCVYSYWARAQISKHIMPVMIVFTLRIYVVIFLAHAGLQFACLY